LARGRVLLAAGKAAESIDPLRRHHATWSASQPDSPFTAEALYWLGRARQAAGDASGRSMVEQARSRLARSPVASHQRLAAERPAR
jgi:hypothetical protein